MLKSKLVFIRVPRITRIPARNTVTAMAEKSHDRIVEKLLLEQIPSCAHDIAKLLTRFRTILVRFRAPVLPRPMFDEFSGCNARQMSLMKQILNAIILWDPYHSKVVNARKSLNIARSDVMGCFNLQSRCVPSRSFVRCSFFRSHGANQISCAPSQPINIK